MANQEHLDILKQGIDVWNKWREAHPEIQPDLREADLFGSHLTGADFRQADLKEAILFKADLSGADLSQANLGRADLYMARLIDANLYRANLAEANLNRTYLKGTNLNEARLFNTIFGGIDLRLVNGLETVRHDGPSSIGIDTIILSHGELPEIFLRNAGIPGSIIEMIPSLVGSLNPIDFYSCFISYSSKDQDFAERLYADLQIRRVRCWFAAEDMKIGEKIRPLIDEAIRIHDKVLLVLSENSVESAWVEKEVETAFEKERLQQKLVLFPIRLDDSVMHTSQAWAADIRRTRYVGDFTHWKNHDDYLKAFSRLLRDLKAVPPRRL